jgi:hypothetical protein
LHKLLHGKGTWQALFAAALSTFGEAPQCYRYPLLFADPIDACMPLQNVNINDSYVLVEVHDHN